MRSTVKLAITAAAACSACQWSDAWALCTFPTTLTGRWAANDGGSYFLRQDGATLWWVGLSADGGKSWTNVYKGTIARTSVTGAWSDVPRGASTSGGMMNLTITRQADGRIVRFSRISMTGGFGGSVWQYDCSDVVLNPVP